MEGVNAPEQGKEKTTLDIKLIFHDDLVSLQSE